MHLETMKANVKLHARAATSTARRKEGWAAKGSSTQAQREAGRGRQAHGEFSGKTDRQSIKPNRDREVSEEAYLVKVRRKLEESAEIRGCEQEQTTKRFKDWAKDDVTHEE
jgi:hypothetical protein